MCDTPTTFPILESAGRFGTLPEELAYPASLAFAAEASPRYRVAKRCVDVLLASAVLSALLPIFPLLMLLVKWSSPGPVFYRHLRIGEGGRPFHLYKFRTMWCGHDHLFTQHLARNAAARREWERHQKLRIDPRITRLGQLLRRYSVDELPQLFHVLTGDMSLVGPRPITENEIARYGDYFALYASVKPGMSGLWQVSGRGSLPYEDRVALDVEYVRSRSLRVDLSILLRTPGALREWQERV